MMFSFSTLALRKDECNQCVFLWTRHVDCTGIITYERNDVDVDSKILKLFLYPKKLRTTESKSYILNLDIKRSIDFIFLVPQEMSEDPR